MPIFKIDNLNLITVKERPFSQEEELKELTANCLETIFGLDFVCSEFTVDRYRIDTLAFDKETKSFVIIEYKKGSSSSIIDQGFTYLSKMLNHKADFVLEYNEKKGKSLKRKDVDWSQSRVLFLADSFTPYQRDAINFKDLPIELWEVKRYNNQTILYNQLKPTGATESIRTISKSKTVIESVSKEVKKYSIEDHFKDDWEDTSDLFEKIRDKILAIDTRIEEKVTRNYIGYKIDTNNICSIHAHKSKLELSLSRVDKEDLRDPEDKVTKTPWGKRGWGKLCKYTVKNATDIDYALFLVKQVHQKFFV